MRVSWVGRLARFAALASLGALLALWTSHVMSLLVVIDACVLGGAPRDMSLHVVIDSGVFGGAPREARCARLARRPACVVDFIYNESSCGF